MSSRNSVLIESIKSHATTVEYNWSGNISGNRLQKPLEFIVLGDILLQWTGRKWHDCSTSCRSLSFFRHLSHSSLTFVFLHRFFSVCRLSGPQIQLSSCSSCVLFYLKALINAAYMVTITFVHGKWLTSSRFLNRNLKDKKG